VIVMARVIKITTGAISITFTAAGLSAIGIQNVLMPVRVSAINAPKPEKSIKPTNHQVEVGTISGVSNADNSANFATKPDSGGMPAINSMQMPKHTLSTANAPGISTLISSIS